MVITYAAPDRVAAPAPPEGTTASGHRSLWPSGLLRPRPWWCVAVVATYAIGAWLLYLPLGLVDSAHIAGAVNADQADQVWFLALADWCVVHAHLSPFTTLIDYPSGINLLDNAGMPRRRVAVLAGGVAGLAALAGSVALALPATTYPAVDIAAASAFEDQAITGQIPAWSMVLTYPYPSFPNDQAVLWQAIAGMQFSVLGGYGVRPGSGGAQTHAPVLPQPSAVPDLLLQAWSSSLPPPPLLLAAAARQLPAFVSQNHVSTLVVDLAGADPDAVVALFSAAFGKPRQVDGFDLWPLGPAGA
jgi:hypothetical protein